MEEGEYGFGAIFTPWHRAQVKRLEKDLKET